MTEPTGEAAAARSAGALLRAAREARGVHIAALAAAIKVAPRKLDALEGDRWNELPDATFTRALAQTVCRALKIEARPVLDLLPPPDAGPLEPVAGGLNAPFSERRSRDQPGWGGWAVKPMVVAAGVLLLAALLLWLLPPTAWLASLRTEPVTVSVSVPAPSDAASEPAAAAAAQPASAPMASEPGAAPASGPGASAGPASPALPMAAAPAGGSAVTPAATAAAAPAAATETTPTTAPAVAPSPAGAPGPAGTPSATAAGLLKVRTTEASWVEVRDGAGRTLLSRVVQPGETVGLDGTLPLRLVIGNSGATQITFRGQAVDLPRRGSEAVSRLELQ